MRIVLLGPPGSGKGTQAKLLSASYSLPHISTGDIFRENISKATDLGKEADSYISKGNLVPDDLTNRIVEDRLAKGDCASGFLLDGYPRTIGQAEFLDGIADVTIAVEIRLSEREIVRRLGSRRMCQCGAVYSLKENKPKKKGVCDKCGSALYQRDDDKPDVVKRRFEVYHKQTSPLIEYYKGQGKLCTVDGKGGIEAVTKRIMEVLSEYVKG